MIMTKQDARAYAIKHNQKVDVTLKGIDALIREQLLMFHVKFEWKEDGLKFIGFIPDVSKKIEPAKFSFYEQQAIISRLQELGFTVKVFCDDKNGPVDPRDKERMYSGDYLLIHWAI